MKAKTFRATALALLAGASIPALVVTSAQPAAAAGRGAVTCTGPLSGAVNSNVVVPAGATCSLGNADVAGNVTVYGTLFLDTSRIRGNLTIVGGSLAGDNDDTLSTIDGNLTADASVGSSNVCGITIGGNLTVKNSTSGSSWAIGGGASDACEPADEDGENVKVGKNLTLENNLGAVSVGTAQTVTIAGNLSCSGNSPAPTVGVFTARKATGQCAP